jgi:hypothetical protein
MHPQRVLETLAGTGAEAVEGEAEGSNAESGHEDTFEEA